MSIIYESIALGMLIRAVHCVALVCGLFHFRKPLKEGETRRKAPEEARGEKDCCLWIELRASTASIASIASIPLKWNVLPVHMSAYVCANDDSIVSIGELRKPLETKKLGKKNEKIKKERKERPSSGQISPYKG
jgi:hypothetical protein